MTRYKLSMWLLLLLLALSCVSCGKVMAMEMTTKEWSQYSRNLTELRQLNESSMRESAELRQELTALMKYNEVLRLELETLRNESDALKAISGVQRSSLENANRYLDEYVKEVKARERRIKLQRAFAYSLVALLLCDKLDIKIIE